MNGRGGQVHPPPASARVKAHPPNFVCIFIAFMHQTACIVRYAKLLSYCGRVFTAEPQPHYQDPIMPLPDNFWVCCSEWMNVTQGNMYSEGRVQCKSSYITHCHSVTTSTVKAKYNASQATSLIVTVSQHTQLCLCRWHKLCTKMSPGILIKNNRFFTHLIITKCTNVYT